MGRKKQKVRWTSVEDAGFFDSELSNSENTNPQNFEKTANQQAIQSGFHQENFNQSAAGPGGLVVVNSQQYHHQNNSNHHTSEQNIPEQLTSQNHSVTSTTNIPNQYQRSVSDNSSMRRGNFVKYSNGPGGGGDRGGNGSTSRRSGGGGYWSNASLPPRFERSKQTSISNSSNQGGAGSEQYELDSNFETEELPNGFTKIRSKNLDVLFRKDYYAQRMLSTTSSSAVSSEAGEPVSASEIQETDLDVINLNTEPTIQENEEEIEQEVNSEGGLGENSKETTPSSPKEATPFSEKIPEVTKKPVEIKSKINTNAVPFYPSTYVPPLAQSAANTSYQIVNGGVASTPSGNAQQQTTPNQSTSRPSLFLYSPSSNTMIPCEEIIIPNAVMPGTDVYQGPSNIYLAFPTDGNAPGGQGQQGHAPGGVASQSPVSGNGSVTSPSGGTSSNCSPPQAQSPPHSYIDATGGPGTLQATPTTTPAMVQYDHYGVPYTTYTPVMPNSSQSIAIGDQQATPTGCASVSSGGMASADCSSADSTTPHSPPDLSVYNPANWVPDPAYLAQAAAGGVTGATPTHPGVVAQQAGHAHPYQYYPYYQHHHPSSYYNFRNGHASYHQYLIESSAVPSSAGESQNEDRSEGEDTSTTSPNTATTTTSNSPKKEPSLPSHGGVASTIQSSGALSSSNNIGHHSHKNHGQQQSDSLLNDNTSKTVFIPGLPVTNLKRPPKKRRKKKPSSANPNSSNSSSGTGTLLTTINGNSDHRGSTDSGENEKNNVLQAITILQRSEGQANGFSEGPLDSTTEPAENSAEMEDSEEVLDDDQTPDPNAEHVNDEPVELEHDQKVTEIEAELIPEDAKILSDTPNLPPLKESFKEILVKQVFDEEILIVTQSETKPTLLKNINPEPETKPAETYPDLSENNTDLSNADIDEQQKTETEIAEKQQTEIKENSPEPITNSPIAENDFEGHEVPEGIATPSPTPNNNLIDETEPDLVPEVSIKQPARSHHRRRRGARKSEKNKKQNPNYSGQNSVEGGQTENESGDTSVQQEKEIISDYNNKSVTGTNSRENAQCAQKRAQIEKQPGWEMVPKEIIADPDSGWETATRKGGRQRVLHVTPIDSRDVTPSDAHRVSMDPRIVAEKITEEAASNQSDSEPNSKAESEVKDDTIEILKIDPIASALDIESQNGHPDSGLSPPNLASASLPASRKSTLKRTNRKKRASQGDLSAGANAGGDGKGTSTPASGSSLSKPVLISDRDYDVASAIAAQRRYKSAFDVLDESKIKDLVNQGSSGTHLNAGAGQDGKTGTGNGTFDTLYISDIGYGMNGGPISMGRFGLGKYMPPDRSNEIQSLENPSETNKNTNQETNENTPNDTIKDDDLEQSAQDNAGSDKSSIIQAMMDQVIRASSGGNVNKISGINSVENLDQTGNGSAGGSPTNGSNLTYIRDAERFTEISAVAAKLEPELVGSKIAQSLTPTKTTTMTSTIPTVKENPILKSQELDLD